MADAQTMRTEAEKGCATEPRLIELLLDGEEAAELLALLDAAIADLSPEIADTDNAHYRTMLRERRERLRAIRGRVSELSRPGDVS